MRRAVQPETKRTPASVAVRIALLALMGLGLVGCGSKPPVMATRTAPQTAPVYNKVEDPGDSNDLMKNPFVAWVKRMYPREAAGIINHYLSTYGMGNNDPQTEIERAKLRTQVIETVLTELEKNLTPNMPQGVTVARVGKALRCSGVVDHDGHKIAVSFDFVVYLDRDGMVWIEQPDSTVKGEIVGFDPLARLFGGDIRKKTREEIIKALNAEGPKNAARTPGLAYMGPGMFKVNPGVAFVAMPS